MSSNARAKALLKSQQDVRDTLNTSIAARKTLMYLVTCIAARKILVYLVTCIDARTILAAVFYDLYCCS